MILAAACSYAQEPPPGPVQPEVVDLGGQRYRVGPIEVDAAKQRLTVPGAIIDLQSPMAPLEYLVVAKDGYKAYESLLELDATAFEFNLACILIGLKRDEAVGKSLRRRFDPQPTEGERVALKVSWEVGGRQVSRSVTELIRLRDGSSMPDEWVYTGSKFVLDGRYLAHEVGTVVGLMHDPASIIEHRTGVGLGKYGMAGYDPDVTPPAGTRIVLTVERIRNPPAR